jgi:hypothetical protein
MARTTILILAMLLVPVAGWCAGNELRTPLLGYLVQEDPLELRAISGIPGAAIRSEPLPLPEGLTRLRLAPGHGFALAERGDTDPGAVLMLDGRGPLPLAPISGALARADLVSFSPSGRSAALYSASEQRLQVLIGLPDRARVSLNEAGLEVVSLAVSDDGEVLLTCDKQGMVYAARAGEKQPVFRAEGLSGMIFLPNRTDALVCDRIRGEVFLLGGFDGTAYSRLLASGLDGPGAVRAASDGLSVLVAGREGNRAWLIDVATAAVRAFELPASPVVFEPLRLPDAYLFASPPGEPAWMLVKSGGETRSYFIPGLDGRDPQ